MSLVTLSHLSMTKTAAEDRHLLLCPYEIAVKTWNPETLQKLQLRYVAPDEVTLSPKLFK
ncbi:MAG: hypothetical protein HDR01_10065 [Lachnospiraceae bacterium]|nr:hypothetical protein [Lachnospiraceae bacterium]